MKCLSVNLGIFSVCDGRSFDKIFIIKKKMVIVIKSKISTKVLLEVADGESD